MTLPNIGWGRTPWTIDEDGLAIYDADENKVLDIRGYGRLTGNGSGGLGLAHEDAAKAQAQLAQHVVELINASAVDLKKKVLKEKIREAIHLTKEKAVAVKDDGTGGAIMSIDEEVIIKFVLG